MVLNKNKVSKTKILLSYQNPTTTASFPHTDLTVLLLGQDALEQSRWNRTEAAKKLGISFRSIRYRLKKLGLDHD